MLYLQEVTTGKLSFVSAKNRMIGTTMQSRTIPVLELYSMSFVVETMFELYKELVSAFCPVKINNLHVFSDSMISLNWMNSKVSLQGKI